MGSAHMRRPRSGTRLWRRVGLAAAGVAAFALAAAACTSNGSGNSASGTKPVKGGVAVMAEPPSSPPSYIFPFMDGPDVSNVNLFDFTYLMYRPLYWFGQGSQPVFNPSLSLASAPVFSGRNVTITLKHYMWSNGTPVTAQDIAFFINMDKAVPSDWFDYSPGAFPTNVSNVKVVSSTELTMTMNKSYSPTWFQYNELSQITPMPVAWDRTASGPSDCATTVSDCAAVYSYLAGQAKDLSTYATSPIWSIVDGPWKLSAFNADGHITFVPNKSYSGPVKPKLSAFQEVPFTTDAAEYDVLQSPSSSTKIDVGYLPEQDATPKPANATVGTNPLASKGYTLNPLYTWGFDFYVMNFQSTDGNGPVIKQLYFRQALAYLTDQKAVIEGPMRGYGAPTVGPVGSTPLSKFLSPAGKAQTASGNGPFPFSIAKAKALLTSHGWTVNPGGTTTCTDPSKCGPGIAKGKTLSFSFPYASGLSWLTSAMTQLQSNASQVGIKLNLQPKPINQVLQANLSNCIVAKESCNWDFAAWGGGTFSPDYLPTGEIAYLTGAITNSGGFNDPENNALIEKTLTSGNVSYMYQWEDYLAQQLPQEWLPDPAAQLTEIANDLKGVTPQSSTLSINPENWYFVK
ncbi:MAG TPA: ABC transporter substrate-binding protein [Streptosporangiaceae bacterium]|nr:ABC transporter substrate-binding protein [Streptosporangiaceae bacterium]HUN36008.1 ABC transporter substrate-binding protein [Trebonia sp.]